MTVRTLLLSIVMLACVLTAPGRADDIGQSTRPTPQTVDDISIAARPLALVAAAEDMAIGPTVEPVKQPAAPARTFEISHRFQVQR